MTSVTLSGIPSPAEQLAALPVSLTVSRAALEHLATACGATLPWWRPEPSTARTLAEALGEAGAERPPGGTPRDPVHELAAIGALGPDGRPEPSLVSALRAFATADVVVDLDLSVRRAAGPHGSAQLHAWHRLAGDRVTTMTYAGGDRVELGWFGSAWWQPVVACLVPDVPSAEEGRSPDTGLSIPLPLWLGAGEALRTGRPDLLAVLLERHRGRVLDAAGRPLGPAETEHQVRLAHESVRARLRAVVAVAGDERRLGLVSWLRYADGWRALTPVTRPGGPAVRLDRVTSLRLGAEIARLAAGVRS